MAPTPSTPSGAGGADLPTTTADKILALVLRHLTTAAAAPLPHRRRASANANTVPESYGLPNSPPPGIVAAIVIGSVAAFLFALWVIYFCINFGVPGRQVWSDRGSVTNVTTATSVVSASRRRKRSTVRRSRSLSRSRSRSRVTSGTIMTNAGPAAAAAAVIAAENARRSRSGGRRFLKVKKSRRTRSGSGPDMVEVRKSGGAPAGGGRGGRYAYHNPNEDQIIVEEEMTDRSALGGGYEASSIRSRSRSRPPMRMPGEMPPRGIPVTMGPGGGRPGAPLPRSRAAGPGEGRPPRAVPSSVMSSEDYSHSESESEDDEIVVMEENSTPPRSRRGGGSGGGGGGRRDRR